MAGGEVRDADAVNGMPLVDVPVEVAPPDVPGTSAARRGRRLRWLVAPAILLLLVIVVRAFLVAPFVIPSGSMEDTLRVGDRILVTRTTTPADLRRGDVIVFDATRAFHLEVSQGGFFGSVLGAVESLLGHGQETDYVKRVIGLPGDRVRCCADDGRLEVNGVAIDEPYLGPGQRPSLTRFDVTLRADRFWVMGDNRGDSADSRAHLGDPGGGTLPGEDLIGKVWVRYWPLDRLGAPEQSLAAVGPCPRLGVGPSSSSLSPSPTKTVSE